MMLDVRAPVETLTHGSFHLVWMVADLFWKIGYGYRLNHDLKATLERAEDGKHFVPEDHSGKVVNTVNALLGRIGRPISDLRGGAFPGYYV